MLSRYIDGIYFGLRAHLQELTWKTEYKIRKMFTGKNFKKRRDGGKVIKY